MTPIKAINTKIGIKALHFIVDASPFINPDSINKTTKLRINMVVKPGVKRPIRYGGSLTFHAMISFR